VNVSAASIDSVVWSDTPHTRGRSRITDSIIESMPRNSSNGTTQLVSPASSSAERRTATEWFSMLGATTATSATSMTGRYARGA
jgi:hypothetical protein